MTSIAPWRTCLFPLTLLSVVLAGAPSGVCADTDPLPSPLSLEQALERADAGPGAEIDPALRAMLAPRQPLFLDCHRLAFGDALAFDPARERPLAPLLAPDALQRLQVMMRFFDVLLADLNYASDNEAMAVAYVQFDRASVRSALGQLSPLRVIELEVKYQRVFHQRTASQLAQQLTRALLADALGRPQDLPRDLAPPTLPPLPDSLPTLDAILAGSTGGGAADALAAQGGSTARALVAQARRQQALELLLRLQALAAAERSARTEANWRDLMLDQSRTLYEQEVTADLGYSMSQQTRTRLLEQRVAYCQALTWAELDALAGGTALAPLPKEP